MRLEAEGFARPDPAVVVRLGIRMPFDARMVLGYLALRAIPGVEAVAGGVYRRTFRGPTCAGILEVGLDGQGEGDGEVELRVPVAARAELPWLVERCRHLLDAEANVAAIAEVLARDPVLRPLVERRPGVRVPGAVDGFELAVRAVLGQQVSIAGAGTLAGRLVRRLGESMPSLDGALSHWFPSPERVAAGDLSGLGLPAKRARAIRSLASAVATGALVLERGADRAAAFEALLALPGIGPWTASYVAMRALGDPDRFPGADLGIRRAMARLGLPASSGGAASHAERWRPWRAYAAIHLWLSLSDGPAVGP